MNRYEALKHAVKAHAGQVDKCGHPYILHPIAVAEAIERAGKDAPSNRGEWWEWRENAIVVALLHDVWEDTDYALPLPLAPDEEEWKRQIASLGKLTRADEESYADHIDRICKDRVACIVKLADLSHNLSPERQDCLPASEAKSLQARYLKARNRIWESLGYEWWPKSGGGS